jgi:hypothetical protein
MVRPLLAERGVKFGRRRVRRLMRRAGLEGALEEVLAQDHGA